MVSKPFKEIPAIVSQLMGTNCLNVTYISRCCNR